MFEHKNIFAGICVLFFAFSLIQDAECKKQQKKASVRGYEDARKPVARKKPSPSISKSKTGRQKVYRVRKGDTLYGIARKHGVSLADLQAANGVSSRKLSPGMVLKIPGPKGVQAHPHKTDVAEKIPGAPCFQWPIRRIVSFRRDGDSGVHPIGLIIAGNPDSVVYTSANGVVKKVGQMRGYGRYVVIKHEGKFMTVYSNLGEVHVKNGDMLDYGDLIGRVSSANILHFQIDREGKPQNPLLYLPKKG